MSNGDLPEARAATVCLQEGAGLSALIESADDVFWSVDLSFRIVTLNSALRRYMGPNIGASAAIGRFPEEIFPPHTARLWAPLFARALNEGPFRQEIPFPSGRILETSFNPILMDGRCSGVSMIGRDITERVGADRALQLAEQRYKELFDGALEGMFQNRADGKPLAINRALAAILGYDSQQDFLNCVKNVTADVWRYAEDRQRMLLELAQAGAVRGFETQFKRKGEGFIWVSLSMRQDKDSDPAQPLLEGFFEDITARKQAEFELRESLESVREAQSIGGLGSYVFDIATSTWTSSQEMDEIFGIGPEFDRGAAGWNMLIHPDDRDAMSVHFLDDVLRLRKPFDKQYRIIHPVDRQVRWVHGWGRLEFDFQGQPARMRGVIKDITQQKLADLQLLESEERFRASFEQAPVGIVHCSFQGEILRCNARFADLLGYPQNEVSGMTIEQVTVPSEMHETRRALKQLLHAGSGSTVLEKRYVRKDRSITCVRATLSIQRDGEGLPLHFIGFMEDINPRKAAEERLARMRTELQRSEERYRTSFQTSADAININRICDGVYIDCNHAFLDALGYSRDELMGNSSLAIDIWARIEDRQYMLEELQRNGSCRNLEAEFRTKSGRLLWGMLSASPIEVDGAACVLSVTRDISEAKAYQQRLAAASLALKVSEERYRTVFQTSLDPILINRTDTEQFIDVNQAFLDVMGFDRDEVLGRTSLDLNIWVNPRDFENLNQILAKSLECRNLEVQFRKKGGEVIWGLMSASVIEIDGVQCVLAVARDITEAKAAETEIRSLAFYDPLTGLPNRRLLLERLHHSLSNQNRSDGLQALLFVDLDHFKTLNDTLGHQTGDMLLQQTARRLQSCVRESDTLGRLGGDEFVLMLEDLSNVPEEAAAQAKGIGEKILEAISQPYQLGTRDCRSSASIGISVFGDRRETTSQILKQADIAMYQAKAAGRNTVRFFAPALQAAVNARAAMEDDLREGIRTGQFVLYYQPQILHNSFVGAEALLRWKHPWRNILGPGEFIPLAEETGLILPLGQWVLESACNQIAAWGGRPESAHFSIAVNISARQFRQPDFVQLVLNALTRAGANPSNLKLELTESMLVDNVEEVIAKMKELKSYGLKFSLDDFGTGYSSLAYLKKLPLSQLKIDRSFVRDIVTDESSAAIAQAIISLSRAMGLPVIAEGVETEEQRQFLLRLGCHAFQGYLFSHPLPIDQFEQQWVNTEPACIPKAV